MSDDKICFGSVATFCADCRACRECGVFERCANECTETLKRLGSLGDVSTFIKRHEKIMAKVGLIEDKSTVRKTKKTEFEMCPEAKSLNEDLVKRQLIAEDWIADDLSEAPEYFSIICETLKKYETRKSGEIVRDLCDKLGPQPNIKALAVMYASWSVQVLFSNKIINVTTSRKEQVIKWLKK